MAIQRAENMTGFVDMLTGASAKRAKKAEALQRQQQSVAEARQLSTAAAESARTGLVRKQPRGRRLLADAAASDLPAVVA
jgi:hypothetical protein